MRPGRTRFSACGTIAPCCGRATTDRPVRRVFLDLIAEARPFLCRHVDDPLAQRRVRRQGWTFGVDHAPCSVLLRHPRGRIGRDERRRLGGG